MKKRKCLVGILRKLKSLISSIFYIPKFLENDTHVNFCSLYSLFDGILINWLITARQ